MRNFMYLQIFTFELSRGASFIASLINISSLLHLFFLRNNRPADLHAAEESAINISAPSHSSFSRLSLDLDRVSDSRDSVSP